MSQQHGWAQKEFSCHRCGNCCRGEGYVDVTASDIERAARYLQMTPAEFIKLYCITNRDGSYGLNHLGDAYQSCIHLTEEKGLFGCRIHAAKPEQCAVFPFGWRPRDIGDFCNGFRAAEGLPPSSRKTMNRDFERRVKRELEKGE